MKVVLFCGGLGLRIRDYSETIPKPLVPVGRRPILWHIMKYYAHFGHKEFILCLGYKADVIRSYFHEYANGLGAPQEWRDEVLQAPDEPSWSVTCVDTGAHAKIGERLRQVRELIGDDEMFLANYGDVVTDAPLAQLVSEFQAGENVASFLSVRPNYTFHLVRSDQDGSVSQLQHVTDANLWLNGGYFIFRRSIFDFLEEGDELVEQPFERLIQQRRLRTFRYDGFWAPMDTLKDMQTLEELYRTGESPWTVWSRPSARERTLA